MTHRLDPTERAHLRDPTDTSFAITRLPVSTELNNLARQFWIPTWTVSDPAGAVQQVLQYPVCLIVIASDYQRFYGVTSGLSTTTLFGTGWAVGLMLQPAAGLLLTGRAVSEFTDRYVDLATVQMLPGDRLTGQVREVMSPEPTDLSAQRHAASLIEEALRSIPVDAEGKQVNEIVATVEGDPSIQLVADLCDHSGLTERALQRLLLRRVGIGPKWLIRRRRLHEASERLRDPDSSLADIAADLGYADQSHFTKDYRRATGLTPGAFGQRFR